MSGKEKAMRKFVIGLDVDGVLADFNGMAAHVARVAFKLPETPRGFDDAASIVGGSALVWKAIEERKGTQGIRPLQHAEKFVADLRKRGHTIFAVTSPPRSCPTWAHDRVEWLEAYFKIERTSIYSCPDKTMWGGDILIDDHKNNIEKWRTYWEGKRAITGIHFVPSGISSLSYDNVLEMIDLRAEG